ncbi:MAG: flagellar basal-body MS-ring/collar protein FliF [Gammaproteobacteria bacterium]|nr:flagellar basal-body MS-ring/collar protein FliF [Gammaproteobacteria bacterium]
MELTKSEQISAPFQGMVGLPVVRQLGLLIGLAASIAIGVAVVLWSQTPDYDVLYSQVTGKDAQAMAEVLERNRIDYRIDHNSGALMVESGKLSDAKLKLAAENLPNASGEGFELIDKDQGFGSSSFIQTVRYQRAQEGELARTIMAIGAVSNARVHLAIPKESAFVRNKREPTASVMVKLSPGRSLQKQQIAAITHLVASSIPNLETSQVTVVDDRGRLLSSKTENELLGLTTTQFEYTRKLEKTYMDRIERLLSPLVGMDGVRAQVTAELDFTRTESTQESFNPDLPALRSEQSVEEQSTGSAIAGGIPGALSNEPPGQAVAPEDATGQGAASTLSKGSEKTRKRSIRNFELDKTISHIRHSMGGIRKLSVAVVLDVKESVAEDGTVASVPYTDEEVTRFTSIVKEAVGFNQLRGDTVNVINAAFLPVAQLEEIPAIPMWEQAWFWSVLKQVAAAALVLFLILGILRPIMRSLAVPPKKVMITEDGEEISEDQLTLSGGGSPRLPKPSTYEDNLNIAKQLASQEPKRVAQVVKGWLDQ